MPTVAMRTGDTPQLERARFMRSPADILITTPESLYLLLTSQARKSLQDVETMIIDEIHALVPGKRGTHLALSLERLELLTGKPLQRIGLSATAHPVAEVARFLGGVAARARLCRARSSAAAELLSAAHEFGADDAAAVPMAYRPVQIVNASADKLLRVSIEVPVEDMRRIGEVEDLPSGPAAQGPVRTSIWQAIHPRLLELIQAHTSTLIFVNARRAAERLSGALNDLAGETVAYAHHGSLSREQRADIEDRLKAGQVRASRCHLVARAGHRHGRDRLGCPDRSAAECRERPAAHRAGRAQRGFGERGRDLPEVPRRLTGVRGAQCGHAHGSRRSHALSAQRTRCARATDRRDLEHGCHAHR